MTELWYAILGAAVALAAFGLADRLRLTRRLYGLLARHEQLGDEIWEVQAAVEARQRAEAASQAKSRFLATVSHEIRTPLNGILGLADLLGATPLDREQQAYVAAVKTSGQALASLIDEILDFSRIEAGRLDLGSEPFELAAVVESVVELLAPRAQDKGLEIASRLDPALPRWVVGDPVRLRQVLTNLAGNAVKFTERGGVGVSVSAGAGARLAFTVTDTGPGVPAEHRTSIFEDFEQGDGSLTRQHGGTGLGLAISRRIVEHMGGEMTLTSRPQGGAIFGFTVDLPPARHQPVEAAPSWPDLEGCRVLVAASSPFQAAYLAERLAAAGAEASVAETAAQALDAIAAGRGADLLFVDCALGEAATERLAAAAQRANVARTILLFSPFERRAFGEARRSGFDGWLVKPVRSGSLAARLAGARPGARPEEAGAVGPAAAAGAGLRILLAEDNEINTLVAMSVLGRLGARVVHACNGTSALSLALSALHGDTPPFDTILLDVSMPGLDGLEVTRRMRAAEAAAGQAPTRIVALTAHAFAEDRQACLRAGMDEVLTKPLDFAKLAVALMPGTGLRTAV